MSSLETLDLSENRLTALPAGIEGLSKLWMLDLGHNELMEVPEAIGELRGLSGYLYLNHNRLATLPVLPLHMVDNWLTPH